MQKSYLEKLDWITDRIMCLFLHPLLLHPGTEQSKLPLVLGAASSQ